MINDIIFKLEKIIKKEKLIKAARIYGSSLYAEDIIDLDVAIIIPSINGIVDQSVYMHLRKLRKRLCRIFKIDIDLVPHTIDEIKDINSPLWHPRYNPSLVFGKDIKSKFPIKPILYGQLSVRNRFDPTSFILHDTRTITRRQAIRSLKGEQARIFLAKLSHGPGNALTYISSCKKQKYSIDPSNAEQAFKMFEPLYNINCKKYYHIIQECKKVITDTGELPIKRALNVLSWYELLVMSVFNDKKLKK
mgnify:CR=1 FL=1